MPRPVTIWHLELASLEELRPLPLPEDAALVRSELRCPELGRFFYWEVGRPWCWFERLSWSAEEWERCYESEHVALWLLVRRGTPVGYVESELKVAGSPGGPAFHIRLLGLLPRFIGQGLGGGLLTEAVRSGFAAGASRVILNTCSLDHEAALPNYRARGFRLVRVVQGEVPDPPPGYELDFP